MYEVHLLNIKQDKEFIRIFETEKELYKFIKKVDFSKKIKVIGVYDWSWFYS